MKILEMMASEFDQEAKGTRRTLERVPFELDDWRPHEKSMPMGALAKHIVEIAEWTRSILTEDEYNIDMGTYVAPQVNSTGDLVRRFDEHARIANEAMMSASDDRLVRPWTLKMNGNPVFTLPVGAVLRTWVLNHIVHHRAQLGVYLRLNNLPVPSLYGPSADER